MFNIVLTVYLRYLNYKMTFTLKNKLEEILFDFYSIFIWLDSYQHDFIDCRQSKNSKLFKVNKFGD